MTHTARVFAIACLVALAACGHGEGDIDEVIGASCASDRDCENRCLLDAQDYPGGFCTRSCQTDNDCPGDAFCIDREGGVCLFACPTFDCSRLGAGWTCRSRDRVSGGSVNVCFGN